MAPELGSLNSIAPSSQPVDFGELIQDPLPALPCFTVQEEGLDPTPTGRRMWEDQEAEDVRMHSIIEAEKSKATWKSFCSRGFEESSEWRASPPNRALHDLHDLNLHEFLEDVAYHPSKLQKEIRAGRRDSDSDSDLAVGQGPRRTRAPRVWRFYYDAI